MSEDKKKEHNYYKRGINMLNDKVINEYIYDDIELTIGRVIYFLIPYLKKALGDKYKPDPQYEDLGIRPYILMGNTKDGTQYISKEYGMSVLEISKEVDNLVCADLRTNGGNVKDLFNGQMYARDKDGEKLAYVEGTAKNGLAEVSGANCSVLHILSVNDKNCTLGNCVSEKVVNRIWEGLENLEEQKIEIFE